MAAKGQGCSTVSVSCTTEFHRKLSCCSYACGHVSGPVPRLLSWLGGDSLDADDHLRLHDVDVSHRRSCGDVPVGGSPAFRDFGSTVGESTLATRHDNVGACFSKMYCLRGKSFIGNWSRALQHSRVTITSNASPLMSFVHTWDES